MAACWIWDVAQIAVVDFESKLLVLQLRGTLGGLVHGCLDQSTERCAVLRLMNQAWVSANHSETTQSL
jgi:hypothetical protein